MDHLHEHQRSTIDRHRQFENQGFPQQRHDPRDGDDDDDDDNAKHHLAGDGDGDDDDGQEQEQEHHQHHHQGDEGEEGDADVDGEGESGDNGVVDHEHHHHDEQHQAMVDIDDDDEHALGSQLTISYQGEVYLFENVTVRKVHEVLTVLGGQEIQSFLNVPSYLPYPKVQGCVEASVPGQRLNPREREEYIRRYREKRERRVWGKRIIYEVRSSVAVKMNRHKGQFASFKVKDEQKPAAPTPPVETVCQGCGCASGTTPMMRKGPAGPKTLCNACGLMWASKGVLKSAQLRELKSPSLPQTLPQPMPAAQLQNQIHAQQSDFVASSPKISRGTKRKTRAA